jgi:hypothetical protein
MAAANHAFANCQPYPDFCSHAHGYTFAQANCNSDSKTTTH